MDLNKLLKKYDNLNLQEAVDYRKFNFYTITNHSTWIEGSRLSIIETQLLLDDGLTPKSKPLNDTLMTIDHHKALMFIVDLASKKDNISSDSVKQINSLVMKSTGNVINTALGSVDSSMGDFRKMKVFVRDISFPNFEKVPQLVSDFCKEFNSRLKLQNTVEDKLKFSFWAHYNLVSIHPFVDGNGRTARLLMNFVQEYYKLPLSIVYKEDKAEYFAALQETDDENNINIFYKFMFHQYEKFINENIKKAKKNDNGFKLLF